MVSNSGYSNKQKDRALSGAVSNTPPSISLPKGGGAIRGMGEKFSSNPVTGTGSMSIPIATSPGRSGFGPQLSLSYDSAAGNGLFGFGWGVTLPVIKRKTDKGLPRYSDVEDSDVFILSGAEDLVPVYRQDLDGNWVGDQDGRLVIREEEREGFRVRHYRPRIEGSFARIERWTNADDPTDIHWRSISKDNILTLYGKDTNSRIFDPENPRHIFSWLICETRDDKGNCVLYEYKEEDGAGVDLARTCERNRGDPNDCHRKANRYLKHIRYGNRTPLLDANGKRPTFLNNNQIDNAGWMFQVVFDYGEHDPAAPKPDDKGDWDYRSDPFSSYRSTFEVRTTRLCQRVLMFHHFPDEPGIGKDCLVRSTDFTYAYEQDPNSAPDPVYTFLHEVTQNGYKRNNGGYLKRSLPPIKFEYSQPEVQDNVEEVDPESLENLPIGLDGQAYQWADLNGEGIAGILTEQGGAWFYKRNLSPITAKTDDGQDRVQAARFAALEKVAEKPNLALAAGARFMDLAGDGQPDLVVLEGPEPGLFEHDEAESWQPFRPFTSRLYRNLYDPNSKLIDLTGDGHADILITEDSAFVWHASLAEEGFGPAQRVAQVLDEESGPRLVFADGTQSIYTADLSGDGLSDIALIRNGEVCYWPNLGYGRFGAKVTMDNSPWFDSPDQFDQKRIRLADIDGSGTTDIIYLHRDGVRLYFNQSGNGWSEPQVLSCFPQVDNLAAVQVVDLLGNGTACLVWSSPLPANATQPMRYVNLMGGQKPHLLVRTANNLGAETLIHYAPSTKFYLQDKLGGKPWITRLPFPVHVVERVETYDHISRNRFVTRYAYHHGYFDGMEREFRGFGMVEQWDTEELGVLKQSGDLPNGSNIEESSHVPPAYTKTWFHTGVYLGRDRVSRYFAGLLDGHDTGEYYREPGLDDRQARELLLPDTVLPDGMTVEEERQACRALKGSMLRQEVYADDAGSDATEAAIERSKTPYSVIEQNFTVKIIQGQGDNRHAVFFTHPREAITYHYERNPADPRIQHAMTLEVDDYGNVLKQVAIGYGRRANLSPLIDEDKIKQEKGLITYTENTVTNAVDEVDAYRTPLPAETSTYELTGFYPENQAARFSFDKWARDDFALVSSAMEIPYEETADDNFRQKRCIEHLCILYRRDDLTGLLPLGEVGKLALPGESYKLAFTRGLLAEVFQRDGQPLFDPADVLGSTAADGGGYVNLGNDGNWWIPSGQLLYGANAAEHFYLPQGAIDPFGNRTSIAYDSYDLLTVSSEDPLQNQVQATNDYRVLQPWLLTDPNDNRSAVAFDELGIVVKTALMGKEGEADPNNIGDTLDDPTTIFEYELFNWKNNGLPNYVYSRAREQHGAENSCWQESYSYSDGFGREIQKKIQAEPGPVPIRDDQGHIVIGENGQPVMTDHDVDPRWVGSGWTIFNNKGKPVKKYEPFFTDTHNFEFESKIGVSQIGRASCRERV